MKRRAVLAASIAALVAAVLIAVSGGFVASAGGVRVSARSWSLPAGVAATLLLAWIASAWRSGVRDDLAWFGGWLETNGQRVAFAIALCTCLAALWFATYSANGADASGYLSQAEMWSRLETRRFDELLGLPDWRLPPSATTPLGWRPAVERGWQVPTYAPGLPLLMAIPHAIAGTVGAAWLVAIAAGVAVLAVSAIAARLGGGVAALLTALILATSPTFLIHSLQPMSDVPVTAAWALCWWFVIDGSPLSAGMAAAVAVAVRPNLAPLAAIPLTVVMRAYPAGKRTTAGAWFSLPVACAGALIAFVQWRWYGSPLTSGYGSAGDLFRVANIPSNARLYAQWIWQAEPALVYTLAAALVVSVRVARRDALPAREGAPHTAGSTRSAPSPVAGLLVFAAAVIVAYLVYAVFEVWTYVRFLLPALAVVSALASAAIAAALQRLPQTIRAAGIVALALTISATALHTARELGVFQIAAVTARAREAGALLQQKIAARAVMLTSEQSGSMRYLTGRSVLRWDALDRTALRTSLALLDAQGYEVWWVLDQFEEPLVRTRFAGVPEAALDWKPEVEAGPLMRTRAWRIPKRRLPN